MLTITNTIVAVKGKKYAELVHMWSKLRMIQSLLEHDQVPAPLAHAVMSTVSGMMTVLIARHTGAEIDIAQLDDDARAIVNASFSVFGIRVKAGEQKPE